MKKVKIYALVNPINNCVVYVGATAKELNDRLNKHIWVLKSRKDSRDEKMNARVRLFKYLVKNGETLKIVLLEECNFYLSNERESYYFNLHKDTVLQKSTGNFIKQKRKPIPRDIVKKRIILKMESLGYKPGSISNLLK